MMSERAIEATARYVSEKRCCSVCDRQKQCHICGDQTLMACSDCQINFAASVYVCAKSTCRDEHERKCYGDGSRAALAAALPAGVNEIIKKLSQSRGHWTEDAQDCIPNLTDMERDVIIDALKAAAQRVAGEDGEFVDIVFDGPPAHLSGRFIEVENDKRQSIDFGEWVIRDDGYWVLRIHKAALALSPGKDMDELCAACGEPRREHVTPGGTRYGPTTLCGVFIPRERVSPGKVEGWREERERCLRIVMARAALWNEHAKIGHEGDCSMSLAEECEDIAEAIRRLPSPRAEDS